MPEVEGDRNRRKIFRHTAWVKRDEAFKNTFEFLQPNSDPTQVKTTNPTENLTLHPGNRKAFLERSIEKEILKEDLI